MPWLWIFVGLVGFLVLALVVITAVALAMSASNGDRMAGRVDLPDGSGQVLRYREPSRTPQEPRREDFSSRAV